MLSTQVVSEDMLKFSDKNQKEFIEQDTPRTIRKSIDFLTVCALYANLQIY